MKRQIPGTPPVPPAAVITAARLGVPEEAVRRARAIFKHSATRDQQPDTAA